MVFVLRFFFLAFLAAVFDAGSETGVDFLLSFAISASLAAGVGVGCDDFELLADRSCLGVSPYPG